MELIGQENLLNYFNKVELKNLPHAIIFEGKFGCGKHLLCKVISEKFKFKQFTTADLPVCKESFDNLYNTTEYIAYIITQDLLTEKNENTILKFLEEPPVNVYIFILVESCELLLKTVINRCAVFKFKEYTQEELAQFYSNDISSKNSILLKLADTPGKILAWSKEPIDEIFLFCNKFLEKISTVSLPNALTVLKKIKLSTNDEGYSPELFGAVLVYCSYLRVLHNSSNAVKQYEATRRFVTCLKNTSFNKTFLFENYICQLRGL